MIGERQVSWLKLLAIVAAFGFQTGCQPRGARIAGKVVLHGKSPQEIVVRLDPASATIRGDNLTTRHYVVSPDGGLANVLVFISKGLENQRFPPPERAVTVAYRRGLIEPYVVGVQAGQPVRFKNRSPLMHDVHATPKAPGNREFNVTLLPAAMDLKILFRELIHGRPPWRGGTAERRFMSPDIFVRIKCPMHPWEFGYIAVLDHPFFAVTDKDGRFELPPGLLPGKYVIQARHLKAGAVTQEITVAEGERRELNFTLEVPAGSRSP